MSLDRFFASPTPLAVRMRPRSFSEVLGQQKLLAQGSALLRIVESKSAASVVLWGPPGTGKTTLAGVIALQGSHEFKQLSAISAGVKDVREVIENAKRDSELYQKRTVLFLDEIHRFTKAQQDSLLPAVEAGWVILVAATTENPSFSVISPLLSRSLVLQLKPLSDEDLRKLLSVALADERGFQGHAVLEAGVTEKIIDLSGGDARRALTILEAAVYTGWKREPAATEAHIDLHDLENSLDVATVRYDRAGDQHYDIISAFIKSVRGSDADAAVHYLARMLYGGEDPRFIARRLMILAAEDIGLADPTALALTVAVAETVAKIGMPEARIPLSEATIYLALAPKSNSAYLAINAALEDVANGVGGVVPAHLRSTALARADQESKSSGYKYPHDASAKVLPQQYAPDDVLAKTYYQPTQSGLESGLAAVWAKLRAIIRS